MVNYVDRGILPAIDLLGDHALVGVSIQALDAQLNSGYFNFKSLELEQHFGPAFYVFCPLVVALSK